MSVLDNYILAYKYLKITGKSVLVAYLLRNLTKPHAGNAIHRILRQRRGVEGVDVNRIRTWRNVSIRLSLGTPQKQQLRPGVSSVKLSSSDQLFAPRPRLAPVAFCSPRARSTHFYLLSEYPQQRNRVLFKVNKQKYIPVRRDCVVPSAALGF